VPAAPFALSALTQTARSRAVQRWMKEGCAAGFAVAAEADVVAQAADPVPRASTAAAAAAARRLTLIISLILPCWPLAASVVSTGGPEVLQMAS
jgi:hypothetical protein